MCTALSLKQGDVYFGRNLDLDRDFGQEVAITPRNYPLTFKKEAAIEQHYAFIGMATVVQGYPLYAEAVNEKGLGMAGLNFPGFAQFAKEPKDGAINLTPYEIINWVLGRFGSVAELRPHLEKLCLVGIDFLPGMPVAPLHWIVSDDKESIVLEHMADGLHVTDNPVGVMTNNPEFRYHLLSLSQYMGIDPSSPSNTLAPDHEVKPLGAGYGSVGLPGDYTPNARFIKTVFGKENSQCAGETEAQRVAQFFHILDSVKVVRGSVKTGPEAYEITTYSSCVNTRTGDYYYKTYHNPNIQRVSMSKVDLDGKTVLTYPLVSELQFHDQN